MNFILKTKLCTVEAMRIVRIHVTGSKGAQGAQQQATCDFIGSTDPSKTTKSEPLRDSCLNKDSDFCGANNSSNFYGDSDPKNIVDHDHIFPKKNLEGLDKELVAHLKNYFDNQVVFHKMMARFNRAAVERIKNLEKYGVCDLK